MTRLWPGPAGLDSPELDDEPTLDLELTADDWRAWLDIGAARTHDAPAPLPALAHALHLEHEPPWRLWWDRQHPAGLLTHRAHVTTRTAGQTLLSACGYSTPWHGPGPGVHPTGQLPVRDARRTYCARCTAHVPDQQPHPEDTPPREDPAPREPPTQPAFTLTVTRAR